VCGSASCKDGVCFMSASTSLGNQIPKGYKQTEVGVIPEDWEVVNMASIGETIIGLTYTPSDVAKYGTLVLRSSNIQKGQLAYENNVYVDMELPERVIVKKGDLLICVRNGSKKLIGKCALITEKAEGFAFGAFMSIFRCSSSNYIFYQFQSKIIQKQINEVMGATINQLTNKDLNSFQLPLPPTLEEQQAIAKALSDTDELIDSLSALIDKKRKIKEGAMQELLTGRRRLPEFASAPLGNRASTSQQSSAQSGSQSHLPKGDALSSSTSSLSHLPKGYKQTEVGVIPEDWEVTVLPELCMPNSSSIKIGPFGSALKKEYLVKKGYKVFGQENVYEKSAEVGDRYISKSHFLKLKSCEIVTGDFLISMMGTIGKCYIMPKNHVSGIMDSHLLRLKLDNTKICSTLLIQMFSTPIILTQVNKLTVGGIMDGLSSKIVKSLNIPLPPTLEEQQAIAEVLSDMDSEIEALEAKLAKYEKIKKGMMDDLLTGKVRLV
jgi:type I restriction enzyme S subunit